MMKKNYRILILIAAVAVTLLMTTGCFRQDYMFEDGDFDGVEFSDYDLIQNAELDMDDSDRD